MFGRIVFQSFKRQRRRKMIATVAITVGVAIATALISVSLEIGDKVNLELKAYGANILVVPRGGSEPVKVSGVDVSGAVVKEYLNESDLTKLKQIFWKNNILGYMPSLSVPARTLAGDVTLVGTWFDRVVPTDEPVSFHAGAHPINPYWKVDGRWPSEGTGSTEALVGTSLARRLQISAYDTLTITVARQSQPLTVTGILSTGGSEDDQVFVNLELAQKLSGHEGQIGQVRVSALTTPESKAYERLGKSPRELPPAEFEKWMCTPFVSSISYQLEENIANSESRPIRQIAQSEGKVLDKMELLMIVVSLIALGASALTVTSTMMTIVLERRQEIGLLKALGAGNRGVIGIFLTEAVIIGLLGGAAGLVLGAAFAALIGHTVFNSAVTAQPILIPLALGLAVIIAFLGSIAPLRRIALISPAEILKGNA